MYNEQFSKVTLICIQDLFLNKSMCSFESP